MARYGLAIDAVRCTACYACVIACKSENSTLPGVFWIRIQEKEVGISPKVSRSYTPMLCMQCGAMPCAEACPKGAIFTGKGGVILIDEASCTCRDLKPCISACPFGALTVNRGNLSYFPDYLTPEEREVYQAHRHGAVEKCDLCYHRISAGIPPACVQACPAAAMIFGDLDERESQLARLVSAGEAEPLREDLNVDPSVFYIKRITAQHESAL